MRHSSTRAIAAGAWALVIGLTLVLGQASAQTLPAFTELVKDNAPSVVNISSLQTRPAGNMRAPRPDLPEDHPFFDFFDRFGAPGEPERPGPGQQSQSRGSGFIVSSDGVILTNYHVIEDADEILVRLSDRREFLAEVLGYDQRSDLAVLKVEAEDLPMVRIGASSELDVGEWVLAIGAPFGFDYSVTAGIVSAKGRSLPRENYVPFIQTDVAINPGNSGGPLFNLDGEVVGINSHIYSRTGGFMGLSFAIPIELAMDVADQLRTTGRVARGWLGVMIQDVNRDLAESFGMDRPYGALVADLINGSPAEAAGFQRGDVIVEFDGRTVNTSSELPPMVGRLPVGSEVEVDVIRGGERQTIVMELGELPDRIEQAAAPAEPEPVPEETLIDRLGIELRMLDDEELATLELDAGVVITALSDGPAAATGLRPGDVITMLNQQPVDSVEAFVRILEEAADRKSIPVLVHRSGSPRFFALRLPGEEG